VNTDELYGDAVTVVSKAQSTKSFGTSTSKPQTRAGTSTASSRRKHDTPHTKSAGIMGGFNEDACEQIWNIDDEEYSRQKLNMTGQMYDQLQKIVSHSFIFE
jgi:hypothetical protein